MFKCKLIKLKETPFYLKLKKEAAFHTIIIIKYKI